jgi:hypothetical protein
MTLGEFIVGAVDFLAVVGAICAATVLVVRKRLAGLEGAPLLLAGAIVGRTMDTAGSSRASVARAMNSTSPGVGPR